MTVSILCAAFSVARTATLVIYICLLSSERCSRTGARPSPGTQTATVSLPGQHCQALNIILYVLYQVLLDTRHPDGSPRSTAIRRGRGSTDHHQRTLRANKHQEGGCHLHSAVHESDQLLQGTVHSLSAEGPPGKASKSKNNATSVT